jgi:RNA polymerase sigma-70 factor (ECF subfamily)
VTIVPDRFELALPVGPERLGSRGSAEDARATSPRAADPRSSAGADPSEAAVIRGVRAGSEADLEVLFRRHWPRAYRTALLIVHDHGAAEDIAQEAFLAALRHLGRFDVRRRFGPWLSRIVANRAIDWMRMRSARRETPAAELPEPRAGAASPSAAAGPEPDQLPELLAALGRLTPDHRAVVVLRYVGDLSPGEISRALGIPRGTVNSRLRRGLDQLGTWLSPEEPS